MITRLVLIAKSIWISLLLVTVSQAAIATEDEAVFARVGESLITVEEYKQALTTSSRNTFYHGRPPDEEIIEFQKQVADQIINRELLLQQAKQRNINAEQSDVENELDKYRRRAERRGQTIDENSSSWLSLTKQIEDDLKVEKLENIIRQEINIPDEQELKDFYVANEDKFTEPARFDLSTILLGVAPSAGKPAWDAAREEAASLVARLREGESFEQLATIHSSDLSAEDGGALGYSHKGMFSQQAQEVIEELNPGDISDPFQVLEGIVIFKLNGRKPARLLDFSDVKDRVRDLWIRGKQEQHWQDYLVSLRDDTDITIEEKYLTISGRDSAVTDHVDED